jgi:hypothetical protein
LAMRNFCVSRRAIWSAWAEELWDAVSSACWDARVAWLRARRRRAVSASRRRSSRAWLRVERDSEMRETATLSGAMLKLAIVCRMSWRHVSLRVCGSASWERKHVRWKDPLRVTF